MTSVDHNVMTNATGILTVSSKSKRSSPSIPPQQPLEIEMIISYEEDMLAEIDSMDPYDQHMCAYLALCIEEKFHQSVKQFKFKCTKCSNVLYTVGDKIRDELLGMKAGGRQPSASTLKLVIFANAVMKMYSVVDPQGSSFKTIQKAISENLDTNDFYSEFHFEEHMEDISTAYGHKGEFISELINIYMKMKSHKIGAKITEEEQGEIIRYRRKRAYIEAGQ